jgi:ribose/xylose/arabinose/galactoside ABC-type transport system permease subunit
MILRSGLSAIGVSPHVHEIVTGTILLAIAVLDARASPSPHHLLALSLHRFR